MTNPVHMVSVNPNPPEPIFLDPTVMALPGLAAFSTPAAAAASTTSSSDDLSKKVRKPYTITKSRESWTEPEHDKFLEALQLFDRDWKKIEAFIGSKSVIQAYLLKPGLIFAALALSQVTGSFQALPIVSELGLARRPDSSSLLGKPVKVAAVSSRTDNSVQAGSLSHATQGDMRSEGKPSASNCCSSTESTPRTWPSGEMIVQGNHGPRVLPDFVQVYSFIGSIFDPNVTGQLGKLKKMDPIDVETVLLLMRNLSINLTSPEFKEDRRLLSSDVIVAEKDNSGDLNKNTP
ncbi:hypothetical protein RHGRI_008577 [Rhododendron griersonianum]|uniref:SANT domain-containing protein n=1 Tax=Rhododendron griersonianum TaxID=479676 RepID=A0AAV6L364_9ERIC|nr:hypothetical protein RHGRI_008577 [Rhododendron griersonianum]